MLAKLKEYFAARRFPAYLVGGYLRDSLLSLSLGREIDIAVQADPQAVGLDLAQELGGVYVPLSPAHGVARVVVAGIPAAGQPLAEQQSTGWSVDLTGFSGNIEEDLARRDFTVDALALPLQFWALPVPGEVIIDPFHGREDLVRRSIRAVGPGVFRDDPGRLLRAVRLAARLKFRLEPGTARLVMSEAYRISQVSRERVRDEFLALLSMDGARAHLEVLDRLDLLCRIIPELAETKGVEQPSEHYWDVWGHLLHTVETGELITKGHQNSPIYSFVPWTPEMASYFSQEFSDGHSRRTLLKLAALFHDIAKPQTKGKDETGRTRFLGHPELGAAMTQVRLAQLRLSSRGIAMVAKMVEQHLRPTHMQQGVEWPTPRAVHRYFRDLGEVAIDTLYLSLADYLGAKGPLLSAENWASHARMVAHILEQGTRRPAQQGPCRLITGHELMKHFNLGPGPLIGDMLESIGEATATGEIANRGEALVLAAEVLRSHRDQR
jgi:poly(A) polymerase